MQLQHQPVLQADNAQGWYLLYLFTRLSLVRCQTWKQG